MKLYETKGIQTLCHLFNRAEKKWESEAFIKLLAEVLVTAFLGSLLLIFLRHSGYISWNIIPINPFKSIEMAFTLLLFFEVIALVFSLVKSVSKSMEIQLQILSLILLRDAFKLFGAFPENFTWKLIDHEVIFMFVDAFGALLIFAAIIFIRKYDQHHSFCNTIDKQKSFISVKKIIALILMTVFLVMIGFDVTYFFLQKHTFNFFHLFFSLLIFNDILIVLISMRYSGSYRILFRNSGYALATITMRLALELAQPYNVVVGLGAAVFVFSLVITYNRLPFPYEEEGKA